jgi:hypothetical protein
LKKVIAFLPKEVSSTGGVERIRRRGGLMTNLAARSSVTAAAWQSPMQGETPDIQPASSWGEDSLGMSLVIPPVPVSVGTPATASGGG